MLVRSAREGDAEVLADRRARPVAAGEERGAAGRSSQLRLDAIARLLEAEELDAALHLDAELREPLDEESLVLVLRIDEGIGKRAERRAERAELDVRRFPSARPEVRG